MLSSTKQNYFKSIFYFSHPHMFETEAKQQKKTRMKEDFLFHASIVQYTIYKEEYITNLK